MKQTVGEPSVAGAVEYPSSDGRPMAETQLHFWIIVALAEMLYEYFERHPDVHVAGDNILYYEEGNREAQRAPDVMVVKGVEDAKRYRDSFLLWQEKAVPCVVIEVTSKGTAEEDMGPKKEVYQRLGVREYFLFDPRNEYLPRQLVGYRLVKLAEGNGNGENGLEVRQQYDELPPAADGSLPSAELGLRLVPRGQQLDLVNSVTGERLLPRPELAAQLAKSRESAEQAEKKQKEAERRAERAEKDLAALAERAEKERKEAAERADKDRLLREALEAEIARLRAGGPSPPPAAEDGP